MENHMLYGGFHCTTDCNSEPSSMAASLSLPLPLPPPFNNLVASSSSEQHLHHHAVSSSSSTTNAFLQQDEEEEEELIRAKVAAHPLFPQLLHNYIDCHKVGATPEMAKLLDEVREGNNNIGVCQISAFYAADPELDDFMETYCNLLGKYKYELSRPFEEATAFLRDMKSQLNSIIYQGSLSEKGFIRDEKKETISKRINNNNNNNNEDGELKNSLLRRYSGYIGSLKNEFSKNKKKEKLPNEAKEILQAWWDIHFKWPYPTDADKVALAEWTGLDQKQINNWFINQRKRHWKPYEEIQAAFFDKGIYGPISISNDIADD